MPRWLLAMALVGCGHIGFDPIAGGDGGPPSDAPGASRWALVQTEGSRSATVMMMNRLGAHHLVVVAIQLSGGGLVTSITDTSSSSNCNAYAYAPIPAAHAVDQTLGDDLQIFYKKDSCPDADTISIAANMSVHAAVVWEVSGIRTDAPLDTAAVLNDQPASTTPLGPKITTSTAGEFVVSVAMVENSVRIHAGDEFTSDQTTNGNGWAHLTDPMAAAGDYQAEWDQMPSGIYCATAAAFRVGP